MMEVVARPRKRLFLGLILVSMALAGLVGYALWHVSFLGLANISSFLPMAIGVLLAAMVLAVIAGLGGIILALFGFPTLTVFQGLAWSAIQLLFPLAIRIGKVFDIDKERVERSFIEVSNQLVRQKKVRVKADKLLILTPHCIQHESCPHKITRNVRNCHACGKCRVGDLLALADKYGVHVAVVTGGTLARNVVRTIRPHAVLAIACERDLTSGIQDTYPLPVVGVLNERPEGPCYNTTVNLDKVEAALQKFLVDGR
ncbi:MAG TPA: DUF116 domain-containing protein [Negativicutes bacterium]|nr:DUF116 domain-containing protein [Negativicutes bacterium]